MVKDAVLKSIQSITDENIRPFVISSFSGTSFPSNYFHFVSKILEDDAGRVLRGKLKPVITDAASARNWLFESEVSRSPLGVANSSLKKSRKAPKNIPDIVKILVIDEIDMAPPGMIKELLELCEAPSSRVMVIGLANSQQELHSYTSEINFDIYNVDQLKSILESYAGSIFVPNILSVVAKTVSNAGTVVYLTRSCEIN